MNLKMKLQRRRLLQRRARRFALLQIAVGFGFGLGLVLGGLVYARQASRGHGTLANALEIRAENGISAATGPFGTPVQVTRVWVIIDPGA